MEQTPSWSGVGKCPFDLEKLTEIARAYMQKRVDTAEDLKIEAIYIQRADRTGSISALNDKWFITITFGSEGNTIPNSVRILPNGTIIEPTAKK